MCGAWACVHLQLHLRRAPVAKPQELREHGEMQNCRTVKAKCEAGGGLREAGGGCGWACILAGDAREPVSIVERHEAMAVEPLLH